jgi:hypothetical protein
VHFSLRLVTDVNPVIAEPFFHDEAFQHRDDRRITYLFPGYVVKLVKVQRPGFDRIIYR